MIAPNSSWPQGWPSFTIKDHDPSNTYQEGLKKNIIKEYGVDELRQAWTKTCAALDAVMPAIADQGAFAVPIFTYDEIHSQNKEVVERVKNSGCCIVRNVIPREEASQYFTDLKQFIANNNELVSGWPAINPAIFYLYSTPVQLKIRTHPNQLALQRILNSFFTDSSLSESQHEQLREPISYPDALRIRQPGQKFLGLGPHIDSGSLARWADIKYRKTYDKILSGGPENYDPYDLTERKDAKPAMFPGGAHCSILRTFQGWTALTPCAPGAGGLMLVPEIKWTSAYMMLRPFFKEPEDGNWRDSSKWTLDDSSWFPGVFPWDSQCLSPASHPHLRLKETLVSIPSVEPGDTIWWHADMCHAVETTHNGTGPASVVYIPTAPSTPLNKAYIRQHWKDLLAGIPADDYKYLDGKGSELILNTQNERKMKGALPLDLLSAEGRRALGEGVD